MTFTQIPPEYAPLSGELRYTVTTQETATLDLRIADAGNGTLIGAKRFAGVTSASFDAAPYLRRTVAFVPTTGSTGFRMADGRTVTAYIEAQAAQATGTAPTVHSPLRTFLPCRTNVTAFALLTSMPLVRLISHGESDELTLFSDEAVTVTVTAQSGTTTTAESYRTATGGLHVFRLDTRDFPEAETLTVDAGACGSVAYTVISAPHRSPAAGLAQQRGRDRTLHLPGRKVGVRRNNQATGIRSRRASGRPNPCRTADGTRVGLRTPGDPRRAFRSPLLARRLAGGGRRLHGGRRRYGKRASCTGMAP